jgi:transcriptional regulator with XRE-family HTH domain
VPFVEPREQFGRNIRRLRLEADLSQMELGNRANLDMAEISKLELARKDPRLSTMTKVAAGLGVPLARLVEGIPDPT